jgi:hypothetical protein
MGERRERPTKRLDSDDLMALAKQSLVADDIAEVVPLQARDAAASDDDPLADWADGEVAVGSQSDALPTTSRTATLADPLTTQLLAEVARRTATMEVDPSVLIGSVRVTQEIDPDALTAALRDAEEPPVAANTKRRTK